MHNHLHDLCSLSHSQLGTVLRNVSLDIDHSERSDLTRTDLIMLGFKYHIDLRNGTLCVRL